MDNLLFHQCENGDILMYSHDLFVGRILPGDFGVHLDYWQAKADNESDAYWREEYQLRADLFSGRLCLL